MAITTRIRNVGALLVAQLWPLVPVSAATIDYEATNLGGNSWQYNYVVTNDTLGAPLEEVTIFFDVTLYENLAVTASPPDWGSLVVQPDTLLPADGFFDSLASVAGIPVSGSLGGFSVSFDYLGTGTPGAQPFDVVNPTNFQVLESGTTIAVIPLPASLWLLISAFGCLGFSARRLSGG
jgi:hypothetical protein